ncbi:MAG: pilus assembly protein, partial [Burkholderiales bacterium]
MQYSCQRNYTILSTDGVYGDFGSARDMNNAVLGDQDANLDGAMKDRVPVAGTLADVAAYYRLTDLRTTAPWCSGLLGVDVCGSVGSIQSMTTFTLGFGVAGRMQYLPNYEDSAPDFQAVKLGSTPNPTTGVCSWQTSGNCTWPAPPNTEANVDDLWHAAVNGGGTYFSAGNPNALFTGIRNALEAIDSAERSTAGATTSNPNITAGDNQIFVSSFETKSWTGELQGRRIDTVTGDVLTGQDWSAGSLLNNNTSRRLLMFSGAATTKLKDFAWSTMSTSEKAHFELANITAAGRSLTQYCLVGVSCLSSATQTASAGEPLVRYLAGERTLEGEFADVAKPWRLRESLLGDIVNSEAVFVGKPSLAFSDSGYGAFASSAATRRKMVYVGSNDGMLHAFDATTGNEVWAFIPTAVLPRLYKLADKDYANKHEFFVDGTPTVQDAFIGGEWRTVLVGSLGLGGRSYFALDITDPDNPKALWEFTHPNMGLTVGRAEIGKLSLNSEWVAVLPSGLNNIPNGDDYYNGADGKGYIYVVNLSTGTLATSVNDSGIIPTGQGSTSTPSGLGHIRAWFDDGEVNATMLRLYGGDNLGNVWRFDINDNVAPSGFEALRLITLKDGSGNAQPVTSRPELGQAGSYAMVYVGTGRYLGTSDFSDTRQQSIYAIKDRLTDQSFDQPRSAPSAFVRQTLVDSTCPTGVSACTANSSVRSVPVPLPVNLATNGGWYVDLPVSSERVTTEPVLALGTLVVTSNILVAGNVCEEGRGWVNFLDYRTGASVVTAQGVASVPLNGLGSRSTVSMLPNGAVRRYTTVSKSPRKPDTGALPVDVSAGGTRRHSWRELGGN